jgi:thiol-disulfide isomerase/thioredoxin
LKSAGASGPKADNMLKRICCVLLLAALGGCSRGPQVELIPVSSRNPATEINASFLNHQSVYLSQLKDKVVMLNFWATWCGPCRMEIPTLVKLKNTYQFKGLEIIGLSVEANNNRPREYFDKFISDNQINYPVGLVNAETMRNYGINPIPATFFIDKSGRVAYKMEGAYPEEYIIAVVKKLLAE